MKKRARIGRRLKHQKYIKRALKKRIIYIVMTAFIVTLAVSCGIGLHARFATNIYQNQEEFKEYADVQFQAQQRVKKTEQAAAVHYDYGVPISCAIESDTYEGETITAFRDQQITAMKSAFTAEKEAEEAARAEKAGETGGYEPLSHALLISSAIYETENGIVSLVIQESKNSEKNKEMENTATTVHTYLFSAMTGNQLIPAQIFAEGYRVKCSEFFMEYFQKNYPKKDFAEGWESCLSSADTNYNSFVVTENGITFFFEEGTVLKKAKGVVYAGMTNEELGGLMRVQVMERYIDPSKPMVALTYDDGPGGKSEERILNILEKNNAVATFFYLGQRISGNEDKISRAYNLGCELGNHTWSHPVLTKLKNKQLMKQFTKTNKAIYKACGAYPTLFRPSYGITSKKINKKSELPVIMWTVDTLDWKSRNGKKVFKRVKKEKELDGKIILLHSIYDSTADATKLLVPWLKKQGYQLVTVSELIQYKSGAEPENGKEYR